MGDSYHQETTYSRKRPFNDEDEFSNTDSRSNRDAKRQNTSQSNPLLKVLIPNYAAGAIIGKGGSNIGELQDRYGAKIRLSPSGEFYPGTEERIVIVTGEVNQIIDMNNYIIDKVLLDSREGHANRGDERGHKVKIVVPNSTAGLVIGKGGATIKGLQEETKAKIVISGRDEAKVPGERIITISGNLEERIEASRHVILKVAPDSENIANRNLTYSNASMRNGSAGGNFGGLDQGIPGNLSALSSMLGNLHQQTQKSNQSLLGGIGQNPLNAMHNSGLAGQLGLGAAPVGLSGMGNNGPQFPSGGRGNNSSSIINSIKTTVSIQMEIPDILVGAILGKQGKTVHEFIQFSGAKIQFSGKTDFAPGTTDRILTIQGDLNQTQIAYFLINQKIMQAENELASGLQRR